MGKKKNKKVKQRKWSEEELQAFIDNNLRAKTIPSKKKYKRNRKHRKDES